MVNFTCNTCGDSLKKKDVSGHFIKFAKCKNAASLTCIDCLKVFGNEYVGHTVCVSEDQRYGANGLGGIQKTKQQIRTDLVHLHLQSILTNKGATLSHGVKGVIEYVLQSAIVPKKNKSYMNFIRNTRKFNDEDAMTVWSFMNEVKIDVSDKPKENKAEENSISNGINSNDVKKNNTEVRSSMKKSKKSRSSDSAESVKVNNGADGVPTEESMEINNEPESVPTDNCITAKTKKKKKSKGIKDSVESTDTLNVSGAVPDNSSELEDSKVKAAELPDGGAAMEVEKQNGSEATMESKKEKKLKKKREKYEAEMRALENAAAVKEEMENIEEPATQQEGKKKKSKKFQAGQDENNEEAASKGKKKRQRTESMLAETDQPKKKNKAKENDKNAHPEEEQEIEIPAEQKDFKWADVIVKVLEAQDDKEMSVKRLCKKVVNEYLSSLLEGAHVDEVKVTAKFQKKLHKTPGVFVHKDKAKLKSSD